MGMTDAKILEACAAAVKSITEYYRDLYDCEPPDPERMSDRDMRLISGDEDTSFAHLLWMCSHEGIPALLKEDRREKVHRWLGFVQGALWGRGAESVENMKGWNMPDPEPEQPPVVDVG